MRKEVDYIFIYGVFRVQENQLLGNDRIYCGKSSIDGRLYRVNKFYPGYVKGDGKVWGDVYVIDPEIFPELDEFEGDEYVREKVRTHNDLECWVYRFKDPIDKYKEIPSGDWLLR